MVSRDYVTNGHIIGYNQAMTHAIEAALQNASNDNAAISRRRFPRRFKDMCVVDIAGALYPVKDWSMCGVLFEADGKLFDVGDSVTIILKFRLEADVIDIPVQADIMRKNARFVAVQFTEVPQAVQVAFERATIESDLMINRLNNAG